MNYFYFFLFIFLSILIFIRPILWIIANWVLKSKRLNKTGLVAIVLGCVCIFFAVQDEYWFERVWRITTLCLGIIFILRGLAVIFLFDYVKKFTNYYLRNYFKISIPISFLMIGIAFIIISNDYIGPQKDISECISDRNIEIICGFKNPEDIVITPDNEFLLMSEFGGIEPYEEQKPGYFALLNLQTKEKIIPNILIEENIWGNSSCKRNKIKKYGPHGIDLVKREDGAYQLGVVNHFPDETIEMFEIFKESGSWNMVWRGCIEVPNEFYFNDISLKTNGGFYASHMYKRDITLNEWLFISLIKKNTGYLVEWSEDGFNKINGSEGSGPNGIALDRKKNIIYINFNQGDSITKFDLNTNTKLDKKFIEAPDNPYIDGDYVWVTSLDFQPNDFGKCEFDISCSLPFSVYKLDKNNLETINKYSFSKSVFGLPTVAVPFNNEIYLGSFHSDRIGIVKTN